MVLNETTEKNTKAKKMKKVLLTGTALAMMGGVFLTGGAGSASAEVGSTGVTRTIASSNTLKPSQWEIDMVEYMKKQVRDNMPDYVANGEDKDRREALEKKFNIKLDPGDTWADKHLENPTYTSKEILKDLGYYGMNASRQELIKYGIRTGDWQPYRAFEAIKQPAYFELVDGKFEYNKIFYGNLIESTLRSMNKSGLNPYDYDMEEKNAALSQQQIHLKELIDDFKNAPGITPYVIGLNGNTADAKHFGVEVPSKEFFNSKYNHPA